MTTAHTPDNPLARAALSMPPVTGAALSIAGRIAGALLAAYIATDQSYDRTQALAIVVAVGALLSLAGIALPRVQPWLMGLGAALVFFAGALFWSQDAGKAMLVVGALAALGGVLDAYRSGRALDAVVSAFFVGAGITTVAIIIIVLTIEG